MPVVQIQKWMKITVIFSLIAMSGCTDNAAPETLRDPHSFAHADEVVMTHLDWDAAIDFAEHRIVAKASIHVKNKTGAKRATKSRNAPLHSIPPPTSASRYQSPAKASAVASGRPR